MTILVTLHRPGRPRQAMERTEALETGSQNSAGHKVNDGTVMATGAQPSQG